MRITLVLAKIIKFEVPGYTHSKDTAGLQNLTRNSAVAERPRDAFYAS